MTDLFQRMVLLPGMGATSAMYGPPWRELEGLRLLDWPKYAGEKTIAELARRIVDQHGLDANDMPAGSSLGGMVALEIAALIGAPRVVLIGSAVHPSEVQVFLRLVAPLAKVTPMGIAQVLALSSSGEPGRQFASAEKEFLRAMCLAISGWEPTPYSGEIVRVHGAKDAIIKCPPDARVIPRAGHLVAQTHGDETIAALRELLERAEPGGSA